MSPTERAAAAHAAAELATHPRDRAALKAAASAWERIAGPGVPWSHEPLQRDLRAFRIELAVATGPFQAPRPPQAPAPQSVKPVREFSQRSESAQKLLDSCRETSSIQF